MRRTRPTFEQRQRFRAKVDKAMELDERKRRLYYRFYRKGFLFIGSWVARLIYFLLFIITVAFYHSSKGYRSEVVTESNIDSYVSASRNGSRKITKLYLTTNYSDYTVDISNARLSAPAQGDTVLIERNIFGKPIYFTRADWRFRYGIDVNFNLYCVILFGTFISFFFNDGLDPFTNKILWLMYAIDLVAIAVFFLT